MPARQTSAKIWPAERFGRRPPQRAGCWIRRAAFDAARRQLVLLALLHFLLQALVSVDLLLRAVLAPRRLRPTYTVPLGGLMHCCPAKIRHAAFKARVCENGIPFELRISEIDITGERCFIEIGLASERRRIEIERFRESSRGKIGIFIIRGAGFVLAATDRAGSAVQS